MRADLTEDEARFVRAERVARLAVVDQEGAPRVAPICPVLDGDTIWVASDPGAKVDHLRREPRCALVFDAPGAGPGVRPADRGRPRMGSGQAPPG